jgi:hypothetical protein
VINRRRDKRFEQDNRVSISFVPLDRTLSGHEIIEASTYNLSLTGAMILAKRSFPVDSILRAQIHLSNPPDSIKIDGQVKWVREIRDEDHFAMGIEFLHEISNTILSLIRHLYSVDEGVPSSIGNP